MAEGKEEPATKLSLSSDIGRHRPSEQDSLLQSVLNAEIHIRHRIPPRYMSDWNKYERLLVFVDRLPDDPALEVAIDRVRASFEVVSLVANPDRRANEELWNDLDIFYKAVVTTPRWYRGGDIFEFSDKHLEELICSRRYGITIHDPEHFVRHLQRRLRTTVPHFIEKISVIKKALQNGNDGRKAVFELLSYILTSVRRLDASTEAGIKHQMQTLLERDLSEHRLALASTSIPWPEASRYLDFPAACRHLRASVGGFKFQGPGLDELLLPALEGAAWRRLRLPVYLACSSRLPAELVEAIFEHILRKEQIPLRPPSRVDSDYKRMLAGPESDRVAESVCQNSAFLRI